MSFQDHAYSGLRRDDLLQDFRRTMVVTRCSPLKSSHRKTKKTTSSLTSIVGKKLISDRKTNDEEMYRIKEIGLNLRAPMGHTSQHGDITDRVVTTVPKAKELRRVADHVVGYMPKKVRFRRLVIFLYSIQ